MNRNATVRATAVFSMFAGVVALGACWSAKIDLSSETGGNDSGAAGASGSSGAAETSAICFADAGLVDGEGFSGLMPNWCGAAPGAPLAFSSPADVTAAITGTWFDCDNDDFFSVLQTPLNGVQLTTDGHISALNVDGDSKLADLSDFTLFYGAAGSSGINPEGSNPPLATASYAIVDASATLGAGTFQMRITASDGTIEQAQILVYASPARVKLVLDNTSVSLVRPVSLQYRAGICAPAFPGGTPAPQGTVIPLAGFPAGRWIWCGGGGIPAFGYGFDLNGDGAAFALDIDSSGNFVAGVDGGVISQWIPLGYSYPYTESVGTCPAAFAVINSTTNAAPGGFYQPIPPQ